MIDGGLRTLFQKHLPEAHWTSVETYGTGRGVPDTHYCFSFGDSAPYGDSRSGWIEFKFCTSNAVPSMRPEQCAWLECQWRVNGRAWVAVRCKRSNGRPIVFAARDVGDNHTCQLIDSKADTLVIIHGEGARHLRAHGISGVPPLLVKGVWHGGPTKWDWRAVREILCS